MYEFIFDKFKNNLSNTCVGSKNCISLGINMEGVQHLAHFHEFITLQGRRGQADEIEALVEAATLMEVIVGAGTRDSTADSWST